MSFIESNFSILYMHTWYVCMYQLPAEEEITMNDEAAVHMNPSKPRNRGQETMPWREIETIANATVFIKGE